MSDLNRGTIEEYEELDFQTARKVASAMGWRAVVRGDQLEYVGRFDYQYDYIVDETGTWRPVPEFCFNISELLRVMPDDVVLHVRVKKGVVSWASVEHCITTSTFEAFGKYAAVRAFNDYMDWVAEIIAAAPREDG